MKSDLRYAVACAFLTALFAMPAMATEANPKAPPPEPKARPAAPESQQDRMKRCNTGAKEKALKGDERRVYMSSCLKR